MIPELNATRRVHQALGDYRAAVSAAVDTATTLQERIGAVRGARAALLPFVNADLVPTVEEMSAMPFDAWLPSVDATVAHTKAQAKEMPA